MGEKKKREKQRQKEKERRQNSRENRGEMITGLEQWRDRDTDQNER